MSGSVEMEGPRNVESVDQVASLEGFRKFCEWRKKTRSFECPNERVASIYGNCCLLVFSGFQNILHQVVELLTILQHACQIRGHQAGSRIGDILDIVLRDHDGFGLR